LVVTDTQRAYERIKERIITTQMPPGAVIQEAVLMAELGLGRTPIREALKILEAEKLVVVSSRRGMFVSSVSISDLAELQEIRAVLDPLCVRLAVARITPAELAEMRALVAVGQAQVEKRDLKALLALDRHFHSLLAKSACNELLATELEMLYNLSARIWYLYLERLDQNELTFNDLAEILTALETKDVGRAEQAILGHIRDFGDAVRRHI
jgi:GntR family transcriptional regulator, rspAB operon transcriptional repressor